MKGLYVLVTVCVLLLVPVSSWTADVDTAGWEPVKPEFEFMMRLYIDLEGTRLDLGKTSDLGIRRIIPITGGTFDGPLLKRVILNQGADWQVV